MEVEKSDNTAAAAAVGGIDLKALPKVGKLVNPVSTVNITTDASFDPNPLYHTGSVGITFWSNFRGGFIFENFVVQNTIFPSNHEAELFGLLMGIQKFSELAFKGHFNEVYSTRKDENGEIDEVTIIKDINIYCDNYTALSTIIVIHGDMDLQKCFLLRDHSYTRDGIVGKAVNTFFDTLAVFERVGVDVLRTPEREHIVHFLCEKLYDAFDSLDYMNGVKVSSISHVKGHTLPQRCGIVCHRPGRFASNKEILEGKNDHVEIDEFESPEYPVPFIKTAVTPIEIYSNCIADALASVRLNEIGNFLIALGGTSEEMDCRDALHTHHYRLVSNRTLRAFRYVFERSLSDVEFVYTYNIDRQTYFCIENTFLSYYQIQQRKSYYLE